MEILLFNTSENTGGVAVPAKRLIALLEDVYGNVKILYVINELFLQKPFL